MRLLSSAANRRQSKLSRRRFSSRWRRGSTAWASSRKVAEIGAVLGLKFDYALLRDVADLPEAALRASLELLVQADILAVEGAAPEACYRFKHALIRDAAYGNLLISHRQALHLRAAESLRRSGRTAAEAGTIARHYAEAGGAGRGSDPGSDPPEDALAENERLASR